MKQRFLTELPVIQGERITLKPLTPRDADGLRELTESEAVYRYLPTFLFEKQYDDASYVIERLYDECIKQSLILGVFMDDSFCGLTEFYGYSRIPWKVSVGYRLLPRCWGQGISTEALGLMVKYVLSKTDVRVITASTMIENKASANVLKKNGFICVAHAVLENWGYRSLTVANKWVKTGADFRLPYRFQT